MNLFERYERLLGKLLLVLMLALGVSAPATAQSVTVTRAGADSGAVSGVACIEVSMTAVVSGYVWDDVQIEIRTTGGALEESGAASILPDGVTACYEYITTGHAPGTYKIYAIGKLRNLATGGTTNIPSVEEVLSEVEDTCGARRALREQLRCNCADDGLPTSSSTSPLGGAQSFAVPVASWDFKGASYGFALSYNSHVLSDPQAPASGFSGIGERNSYGQGGQRWSHGYDQWIDLYRDENGIPYAVWHTGGSTIPFKWDDDNSVWDAEGTFLKLEGGDPITSPTFYRDGTAKTLDFDQRWFRITTADGTKYEFNWRPPVGQQHLVWQSSEGTILPHYLLTRIIDRFGRSVNLEWSTSADPRVVRVRCATRDANGPGVRLGYRQGLLTSVTDDLGRVHTLTYSSVPDERGRVRQQLTQVRVLGPATTGTPPTWVWSFSYRDTGNPPYAYGGSYTGDLVTQKTEPDGRVSRYEYERVAMTGPGQDRYREEDFEGRIKRIAWVDSEAPTGERVITRVKEDAAHVLMTYPGGVAVRYGYDGEDQTEVTDLSTNRQWVFAYDAYHDLTTTHTPAEPTGQWLTQSTHTRTHVTETLVKVRNDSGILTDRLLAKFNTLNLPWEITAKKDVGSSLNDQVTVLEYDGGTGSFVAQGRLTKIIEDKRAGGFNLTTNLAYALPAGAWGLPTAVTGPEGATSSFLYDPDRGRLRTTTSPTNLTPNSASGDLPASVATIAYTRDGLPKVVTDPLGHPTALDYFAESPGSPNTVVKLTHADGKYATVTLDPAGRPLSARDENNVLTRYTYTGSGDIKQVTRAYGTLDETVTTSYYDERGDLAWMVTPKGPAVRFEYFRYDQDGKRVTPPVYEGQVTRITYADNTSEIFGYYQTSPSSRDAGELEWTRKPDGSVITFRRDQQHRVKEIQYPGSPGGSAFSVTYQFDEFGRVTQSSKSDGAGTTTYQYDALNRLTQLVPPSPRKKLDYSYSIDSSHKRWITTVAIDGLGNYVYRDDTKGRLSEVTSPLLYPSPDTWIFKYDKDGKEIERRHPNGTGGAGAREVSIYTTDGRDFLEKVELYDSANTLKERFTYDYGNAGHLLSETDNLGKVHAFGYDYLYRLKQETHPDFGPVGSGQSIEYRYDPNGNRTQKIVNGGVGANGYVDYYGVDGRDRL